MTSVDYTKLLAISVIAALVIAASVPNTGPIGGETILQKSDRLPMASPMYSQAVEPDPALPR